MILQQTLCCSPEFCSYYWLRQRQPCQTGISSYYYNRCIVICQRQSRFCSYVWSIAENGIDSGKNVRQSRLVSRTKIPFLGNARDGQCAPSLAEGMRMVGLGQTPNPPASMEQSRPDYSPSSAILFCSFSSRFFREGSALFPISGCDPWGIWQVAQTPLRGVSMVSRL